MKTTLLNDQGRSNHGFDVSSMPEHEYHRQSFFTKLGLDFRQFYSNDQKPKHTTSDYSTEKVALVIGCLQIIFIIMFAIFAESPSVQIVSEPNQNFLVGYIMFTGILIMMFIGFGYLMTFMKDYGFGAVGFSMLITTLIIQWSLLTLAFAANIVSKDPSAYSNCVTINIYSMTESLFACAAVLISYGAVIGKISPLQLVIMAIIETSIYSINYITILVNQYHVVDPGGTITIHFFGAYFGLAVAYMIGIPIKEPKGMYMSDEIAFIGTLFLFIYWPSFVGGTITPNSTYQQRAIINTILSLVGSSTTTFSFSKLLSKTGKFRPMDIQNATLAGGVVIGAIASLSLSPYIPILVGCIAGMMSTIGYNVIQPILLRKIGLHDTCGIHNLHGMPSFIGGVVSIILAAIKNTDGRTSDSIIYGKNSNNHAALYQFYSVMTTFAIAVSTGLMTGYLLNYVGSENERLQVEQFHDRIWWEGVDDHEAGNENELKERTSRD